MRFILQESKASGRTVDASVWCHDLRAERVQGPGGQQGGAYDDVIRAAWQEQGDVARWKRTWPTGGSLHGPLCQPCAQVWADQKKGSWRKKSEAVSSPWGSAKKMQSEMRTTLPVTVTAPLLLHHSTWWPWWEGHCRGPAPADPGYSKRGRRRRPI